MNLTGLTMWCPLIKNVFTIPHSPIHVLRHSEKQNMKQQMFFTARMQWVEVCYRTALYTAGWVT